MVTNFNYKVTRTQQGLQSKPNETNGSIRDYYHKEIQDYSDHVYL